MTLSQEEMEQVSWLCKERSRASREADALLLLDDVVEALLDLVSRQRCEAAGWESTSQRRIEHEMKRLEKDAPEAGAARLDGRDDFVDVVADDAEAHVLRVLLDDCEDEWMELARRGEEGGREQGRTAAESGLGGGRHHVGLVEDDELEAEPACTNLRVSRRR